jgi:hypothetical protein
MCKHIPNFSENNFIYCLKLQHKPIRKLLVDSLVSEQLTFCSYVPLF